MILAATGHRPPKLGGYNLLVRRALGALAVEYLSQNRPDTVITGMALGWDQAVAGACAALDIPFIAAVPFKEQANRWPEEAQRRWQRLIAAAERVEIISEHASDRAMQQRNRWMVDHADEMLALCGTCNCIAYAAQQGVPVTNLWSRWIGGHEFGEMFG
jgi:uncharacterized phage-like protein YoqJ